MSDAELPELPIRIERVETERSEEDTVLVRLTGSWRGHERAYEGQELLVVQLEDGRHRFPAILEERREAVARPGVWSAAFAVPDRSKPGPGWDASLLIGDAVIPVPESELAVGAPGPGQQDRPTPGNEPEPAGTTASAPPSREPWPVSGYAEDPRSGPLAKLLFRDTVAALHAELEVRAAAAAQLRGKLADAQAELGARTSTNAELEATHVELRRELDSLVELVKQDGALRAELEAGAETAGERAAAFELQLGEAQDRADSLRAELDDARRRIAELEHELADATAQANADVQRDRAALRRAQSREQELADEVSRLGAELATAHVARDSAHSEAVGLRTELDRLGSELASLRERSGSRGGELGEARALLSDARALSAMLRERQEPKGAGAA